MRSCTVRCITDDPDKDQEAFVQAEPHLCDDCRPNAWVILNFVAQGYGVDDAAIHLRASGARKLGEALIAMANEVEGRDAPGEIVDVYVVGGVEGPSLYLDGFRVCGNKPWGGGLATHEWKARRDDVLRALGIERRAK